MTERFPAGSTAYAKDGRTFTVEEVDGGIVYGTLPNGVETDFPEGQLFNESEWAARSGGQDDVVYGRIKRAKAYSGGAGLNGADAAKVLAKADALSAGLLDYVAFTVAGWALDDSGHGDQKKSLSIIKCRDVFDAQDPTKRLTALATVLSADPKVLTTVANQGENILRALIDQGMAGHAQAFEDFCDRPRK